MPRIRQLGAAWITLLAALAACDSRDETGSPPELLLTVETSRLEDPPAVGSPSTLDVGTWNIEWFGDVMNGPQDEDLQLANVAYFLEGLAVDLWAVQEVTSSERFHALVARLEGFTGFLANDPIVGGGVRYYSDFNDQEQKVGIIYREDVITVESARVILGDYDYEFAGRPPLEVRASVHGVASVAAELVVIVLHAKAGPDAEDRDRRAAAARALRRYLDTQHPDQNVLVTGDFNDDIDVSIASGASPYAMFVDDPSYRFVTAPLSRARVSSTIFFPDMIDHQLVSHELAATYVHGSARVFPADRYRDAYAETTSDHLPVTARYGGSEASPDPGSLARGALRWSGATTERVDVYRGDTRVATTANDGRYLDELAMEQGASITYRVCEAESQVCSSPVSVTF